MKKILLFVTLLLFITGCNNTMNAPVKERVADSLLSQYVDGIMKGDYKKIHSVMPDFVYTNNTHSYSEDVINEEYLNNIKNYGDNFKVTYTIKEKGLLNENALNKLNELMQNNFSMSEIAKECYYLEGTITYIGNKNTKDDILSAYYCKYDNTWYLIMN